ncbi:methyltransferase domain-containing protein [Paenibacillus sp. WLX2291]|uniref:methyltransferase domain-containing protein n=1 Tax=Paenibacillus sp. WLX2291 TaxID=3296934 RepID=UPI003983EC4E
MKIAFLKVNGVIAPHIIEDYKLAFEKLEHEILLISLDQNFDFESYQQLINFKPDFVIGYGINAILRDTDGRFLLRHANIPTVCLHYDNPFYNITEDYEKEFGKYPSFYYHLVWDEYYIDALKNRGYENIHYIMLATNIEKFKPNANVAVQEGTFSFVGNISDINQEKTSEIEDIFIEYIINEKINNIDVPVYDLCKIAFKHNEFKSIQYLHDHYPELFWKKIHFPIHHFGSGRLRKYVLNSLEGIDIHAYGLTSKLTNQNIISHNVVPYNLLPEVYQKYTINLNISSLQLESSVNNRVFDVFACKGFVISDYKSDIKKVFPEFWNEITFSNLDDLLVKADYFLTHPQQKTELVEAAYDHIIENHTYVQRALQIIEIVSKSKEIYNSVQSLSYEGEHYKNDLRSCPVCNGKKYSMLHSIKGHEDFETNLYRCSDCATVFMNPQPTENYLEWFYNHIYYSKVHREKMGWEPELSNVNSAVLRVNEMRMDLVESFWNQTRFPRGRLLDVGCSTGNFIWEAQLRYWSVQGIEISEDAAERGRQDHDLDILTGELTDTIFEKDTFDIITAWDVIEHIPNPHHFMVNISRVLKKDGLFVANTPNVSSSASYYAGSQWRHLDPPLHVILYDHISLRVLLRQHNFEILKISSGEEYLGQMQVVARKIGETNYKI